MYSARLAFTIVELNGICPLAGPMMEGNLMRVLHTVVPMSQAPSTFSVGAVPKFVFGELLQMYVSSTSLKDPPSPRWKLRSVRSPIVRWTVTFLEAVPFDPATTKSKFPRGEEPLVFTRSVEPKFGEPLVGARVHTVPVGQPDTLRVMTSLIHPSARTVARVE